jgi:carbamoyl-phosphate synthase large subunit
VLGGRSMEVCYDAGALARSGALARIGRAQASSRPVLVDRFLEDAVEVDVDALCDAGGQVLVCGVMEHIEEAGIHSGDSACVLPPITLGADQVAAVEGATARLGRALGVVGILNVQFAFKGQRLYVLEANPRASRSVPFVEKVTGLPVARAAALLMTGSTLAGLALEAVEPAHIGVKEAVLPFARFPGADSLLGPEMRSTGEVLGIDARFGAAFAKSQEAAYGALPAKGVAFLSVRNADKRAIVLPAKRLADIGFTLVATTGTAGVLRRNGMDAEIVRKGHEGPDNVVDKIRAGEIDLVVNTPAGPGAREDGYDIRIAAVAADIPCITTLSGLTAVVQGIEARLAGDLTVRPLQAWHDGPAGGRSGPFPTGGARP